MGRTLLAGGMSVRLLMSLVEHYCSGGMSSEVADESCRTLLAGGMSVRLLMSLVEHY